MGIWKVYNAINQDFFLSRDTNLRPNYMRMSHLVKMQVLESTVSFTLAKQLYQQEKRTQFSYKSEKTYKSTENQEISNMILRKKVKKTIVQFTKTRYLTI